MHDAHDSIVAGHLGIDKTIGNIRNRLRWDGMSKDVAEYVLAPALRKLVTRTCKDE
jgi:Integrase zinc binding domain